VSDRDPNGKAPSEAGAKLDAGKLRPGLVILGFSRALEGVAEVGTYGAKKYSAGGWESVPNGVERYTDAMWRHYLAERRELLDPESWLPHAAHAAWNSLARLELILRADANPHWRCGDCGSPPKGLGRDGRCLKCSKQLLDPEP